MKQVSICWLLLLLFGLSSLSSSSSFFVSASPLSDGPWGPTNPIAPKESILIVPGPTHRNEFVRVTVLTDRLLRIERSNSTSSSSSRKKRSKYSSSDTSNSGGYSFGDDDDNSVEDDTTTTTVVFEDRKTIAVINRELNFVPEFTHEITKDTNELKIHTKCLDLSYKIGSVFSTETLKVSGTMNCYHDDDNNNDSASSKKKKWMYRYGENDPYNLLGTIRTLDQKQAVSLNCSTTKDPISDHCEWGLISKAGYSIVNDTLNYALTDGGDWWDGRNDDLEDLYIFGHGHDYEAAIMDYTKIGGTIPLLPRYSLGVWFSRWYDYSASSVADDIIKQYEYRSLPLDVLVLDMNWHTKDSWTGYSFDRRLYGPPEDALSYIKSRGLAVTMNLHDAKGVNPWEDKYDEYCAFLKGGCQPSFSIANATTFYGLEDIVLKPLEENGVDFWWIDWQQGEGGKYDALGGKHNPTIWTAHIRSTDANRRKQQQLEEEETDDTVRSMVLSRWGGLGAHRYPVHFSGDVRGLEWSNLAYQVYFSMTGVNVGAIWSHDIGGKHQDYELFTRWLQWGVVSGIMRSHDRGMSAGGCTTKDPKANHCSAVVPWNVPPTYAEANYEALRLRGALIPYLYTAAYKAHKTGLWFNVPMYYKYPELDAAYETSNFRPDPNAKYESQYFLGDDMWAAPVVKQADSSNGLARLSLWVPPGLWVSTSGGQVLEGSDDGSTSVGWLADLNEIPIFARAGAILPTIPVRPGGTIGLARKPYSEIIWSVYLADGAPASGSGKVYEDDGFTTAYYDRKSFTITTATYNISSSEASTRVAGDGTARGILADGSLKTLTFTVSTEGHCEKLPTARATTIRLINTWPPNSVVVNGLSLPYGRFGGEGTWSYESKDAAVIIELPVSQVAEGLQVVVHMSSVERDAKGKTLLDGLGFRLRRASAAKASLDEVRMTPGSQTGQAALPSNLILAASAGSSLEYFAGSFSNGKFIDLVRSHLTQMGKALEETKGMKGKDAGSSFRIARATALLESTMKGYDFVLMSKQDNPSTS